MPNDYAADPVEGVITQRRRRAAPKVTAFIANRSPAHFSANHKRLRSRRQRGVGIRSQRIARQDVSAALGTRFRRLMLESLPSGSRRIGSPNRSIPHLGLRRLRGTLGAATPIPRRNTVNAKRRQAGKANKRASLLEMKVFSTRELLACMRPHKRVLMQTNLLSANHEENVRNGSNERQGSGIRDQGSAYANFGGSRRAGCVGSSFLCRALRGPIAALAFNFPRISDL